MSRKIQNQIFSLKYNNQNVLLIWILSEFLAPKQLTYTLKESINSPETTSAQICSLNDINEAIW